MSGNYDQDPNMVAARMGVRYPHLALGHADCRHDRQHRVMHVPPEHILPCNWTRMHRCVCELSGVCCGRATQEDGLCDACRRYCREPGLPKGSEE